MSRRIGFYLSILIVLLYSIILVAKVPFRTLHLKIRKERFEGDSRYFKNTKLLNEFRDKMDVLKFEQEIWVNVETNSYLMIEIPADGNDVTEKNGNMKYEGKSYNLDYDLEIAFDVSDVEGGKIYDNYTTETPDYKYYSPTLEKKIIMKCSDGKKRKAKKYRYFISDPADDFATNQYIKEIESSDMPADAKQAEIIAANESRDKKATQVVEWIWVSGKDEQNMFLRKTEQSDNVLTLYNLTEININEDVDNNVFENILRSLKVKKIEK